MLGQANISVFASRILWIDEQHGLPPLPLDGVSLHLEQVRDRRRISGSFEPSGTGRIDFATEMADDPLTPSWSGTAYLAAHDVDVARLGLDAGPSMPRTFSGVVSGRVWSTWEGGRPVEAEGTIHARSPGVVHMGSRRGFDEMGASFKVERTAEGWTLAARDLVVATPDGTWPASTVAAMWKAPGDGRDGREGAEGAMIVNVEFARVEDLVALAVPNGEAAANPMLKALLDAVPRGAIEGLHVSVPVTDHVEFERVRARGRFTDLHIGPDTWPVSVDAVTGQFEASGQGVVLEVGGGRLRASAPDWLAHPLQGEKLAGTFAAIPTPRRHSGAVRRGEPRDIGRNVDRARLDARTPGRERARAERRHVAERIADRRGS